MAGLRRDRDTFVLSLSQEERDILASFVRQTVQLLTPGDTTAANPRDELETLTGLTGGDATPPTDPAVHRLLPDAYADDAAAAGEYRRLMDGELRRLKTDALTRVLDQVADPGRGIRLSVDDVHAWLQALNDVRLVLGTRLDVTEDMPRSWDDIDPDDPTLPLLLAYDWLTALQEGLVVALEV